MTSEELQDVIKLHLEKITEIDGFAAVGVGGLKGYSQIIIYTSKKWNKTIQSSVLEFLNIDSKFVEFNHIGKVRLAGNTFNGI